MHIVVYISLWHELQWQFCNVVWPSLGASSFDLLQKPENSSLIDWWYAHTATGGEIMKYGTESRSPVTINHLQTMGYLFHWIFIPATTNKKFKKKEVYMVAPEVTQVAYCLWILAICAVKKYCIIIAALNVKTITSCNINALCILHLSFF